ncbi:MAG: NADPH-dependent assimilatory sulfite reductase hemoprotein subunit [Alphaproteobacteria bacterium]|nr:NADPH-dependent assimilatory sulfite reductase hemoprotein subunit [Alphaproteobacteria bacterium]
MNEPKKLSGAETIKRESDYLKGNIAAELADTSTLDVTDATYELLKFHGSYFGYDRDSATARKKAGLEKEHEFMVRMKCPGGRLTAEQYLGLDSIVDEWANGTLRITTRETFQFHCIKKVGMKPLVAALNRLKLSTLGGCGDVVRNIMVCPAPIKDALHAKLQEDAYLLAKHCAPKTSSYCEIWLDGEMVADYAFNPEPSTTGEVEPLYGETYMPRKFKIAITVPEDNCTDALTNDLAIISLFEGQKHIGYNFAVGGGLGMKHGNAKTFPRLATPIMFVPPELFIPAVEAVVKLQRDHGDRGDRQHARLKYVVEEKGAAWIKATLEEYLGQKMEDPRPQAPYAVEDHTGWHEQGDGKWFLGVPVSSGRIVDRGDEKIRTGLREIIAEYKMNLVLTADQNIILCDILPEHKDKITQKLHSFGIKLREDVTPVYRNMIACVSYPTCGKALAEAERIKLSLVAEIENVMRRQNVIDENIAIRIAGCPNGCSRPYVGDIGIVGRMPEVYALYVGGDFEGTRLNEKIFDKIPYEKVPAALEPMFALWSKERKASEGFGDFCHRYGVEAVKQDALAALAGQEWVK